MKRFAWLWGALLGFVLFPLLMIACTYIVSNYLPRPAPVGTTIIVAPPSSSILLPYLSKIARDFGMWSAGLGCCGAMLWTGKRSLQWRLLSTLVATGTVSFLWWDYQHLYSIGRADLDRWIRYVHGATLAPLLLGALLLAFLALVMRSSPISPTES
jgi:hypothetical protein